MTQKHNYFLSLYRPNWSKGPSLLRKWGGEEKREGKRSEGNQSPGFIQIAAAPRAGRENGGLGADQALAVSVGLICRDKDPVHESSLAAEKSSVSKEVMVSLRKNKLYVVNTADSAGPVAAPHVGKALRCTRAQS